MKDKPLTVEVKDGQLIISIGISTLAFAAETSPDSRLCWMDEESETHDFLSHKVTDEEEFAKDVVRELDREEEDGTTPLHVLFDNACIRAIEDGSIAVGDEPSVVNFIKEKE